MTASGDSTAETTGNSEAALTLRDDAATIVWAAVMYAMKDRQNAVPSQQGTPASSLAATAAAGKDRFHLLIASNTILPRGLSSWQIAHFLFVGLTSPLSFSFT